MNNFNLCAMLNDIHQRIKDGEDPDTVIPWTLPECTSKDEYLELFALIIKYSKIPDRVQYAKKKVKEL